MSPPVELPLPPFEVPAFVPVPVWTPPWLFVVPSEFWVPSDPLLLLEVPWLSGIRFCQSISFSSSFSTYSLELPIIFFKSISSFPTISFSFAISNVYEFVES